MRSGRIKLGYLTSRGFAWRTRWIDTEPVGAFRVPARDPTSMEVLRLTFDAAMAPGAPTAVTIEWVRLAVRESSACQS